MFVCETLRTVSSSKWMCQQIATCQNSLGVDGASHSTAMLGVQERRPTNRHEHLPPIYRQKNKNSKLRIFCSFGVELLGKVWDFARGHTFYIGYIIIGSLNCLEMLQLLTTRIKNSTVIEKHANRWRDATWSLLIIVRFVQQIIIFCFEGQKSEDAFVSTRFFFLDESKTGMEGENLHDTHTSLGNGRGIVERTCVHTLGGFDQKRIELIIIILNDFLE